MNRKSSEKYFDKRWHLKPIISYNELPRQSLVVLKSGGALYVLKVYFQFQQLRPTFNVGLNRMENQARISIFMTLFFFFSLSLIKVGG